MPYKRLAAEWRHAMLEDHADVMLDLSDAEDILRDNGQRRVIAATYHEMEKREVSL